MNGSRASHPPILTPRNGRLAYDPHCLFSGGTFEFACFESSHVEFKPTIGRPPTVSSVNVQLKPFKSNHDVVSVQVFLEADGISLDAGQTVGLCVLVVLDEAVEEDWVVVVCDLEVVVDRLKSAGEEELELAAELELWEFTSATLAAVVDLELTLITSLATRAPTTAPAIANTTMITAIQTPKYRS